MRQSLGLAGRNKVLLIHDNPLITERLASSLKSKGIDLFHTMHLKKAYQIYKVEWRSIGVIVVNTAIFQYSGHIVINRIRQFENMKGISPVMTFALVEKLVNVVKKRKGKNINEKVRKIPKSDISTELESPRMQVEGKEKFLGLHITKFFEIPINIESLASEIKALDFA